MADFAGYPGARRARRRPTSAWRTVTGLLVAAQWSVVELRAGARVLGARRIAGIEAIFVAGVLLAFMALLPAGALANSYSHIGEFGGTGTAGQPGLFHNNPMAQRLAVHGASGKVFVADRGNNRVQVFEPTPTGAAYAFSIAVPSPVGIAVDQLSADLYVTHPAVAARNEVQTLTIQNASSGTYTLSFGGDTTAPLSYAASVADVQTALRALPSVGGANVNVTGVAGTDASRVRTITFAGALAGADQPAVVANGTGLSAGAAITVATTVEGAPALAAQIRKFDADDDDNPESYQPDVDFISPTLGTGTGQVGAFQVGTVTQPNGGGIAVDPTTGDIIVADPGRQLIQRFDSDGGYLDHFNGCSPELVPGSCLGTTRPAFTGVRDVAVTSTGDIIVADVTASNTHARIDRFDGDGKHQATLSQANIPVPNTILSTGNVVVGVNPVTDDVFVSGKTGDALFSPQPARIYQFENDELVADFGLPSDRLNGLLFGLAGGGIGSQRIYALATQLNLGTMIPRIQVFEMLVPADVAVDSPSDLGATGAKFSGTVTPHGFAANWHFEYRKAGTSGWPAQTAPSTVGAGFDPVSVEATVTGLDPNSQYEVRLVARTGGVERVTEPHGFTTLAAPPIAVTRTATLIGDSQAVLRARVNPRNAASAYHFEYGTDSSYGSVIPIEPRTVGAGGSAVLVSQRIAGLESGRKYHFRVVAENEAGIHEGDDLTFETLVALPSPRAYEVVSQVPAGGAPTLANTESEAESGDRVLYQLDVGSPHVPGYELPNRFFLAERGEDGWTTSGVDLPRLTPTAADGFNAVGGPSDLSRIMVTTTASHDPDDRNTVENVSGGQIIAGRDVYIRQPDETLTWATRSLLVAPGTPQTDQSLQQMVGAPRESSMSENGSVLVFQSARRIVEADPHSTGSTLIGDVRLYKWGPGGPQLIGVRPDGSVPTGADLATPGFGPNAVSRDGSRVFWSVGSERYVQTDGKPPLALPTGATYGWPDRDLHRIVLVNAGRLLAVDVDNGQTQDLTGPAGVQGLVAVSEDAQRAYFVANTALAGALPSPIGATPAASGNNLYLVEIGETPEVRFIATLGAGTTAGDATVWAGTWPERSAYASPDGSVLGFGSVASHTGEPTGGTRQLYVYDRNADSLECASCPADGSAPNGSVNRPVTGVGAGWQPGAGVKRWVSTDGTVFFDTVTALVTEDRNARRDVYEYRKGSLRLVSTGQPGAEAANVSGASRDGRTVFFTTADALVPQDDEPGLRKVYAARRGGGFVPRPGEIPCRAEDCQGLPSDAPAFGAPGSSTFAGGGNVASEARTAVRPPSIAGRRSFKGAAAILRVKSPGAGRVAISGRHVVAARRAVSRLAVYRLRVRLKPTARRALLRRGALSVRVRLSYSSSTGRLASRGVVLMFRKAESK